MKEELLNIAMQSLSDDDVKEIVKDKFKKMVEKAVEDAFRWGDLMIEPEQKEIKVTDLFKAWKNKCERDINTDGLDIDYDDGVSYSCVECEMIVEELGKPSWSSTKRALITFENEHDESLNVEIPISKWIFDSGREEPYTLSLENDLTISSLRYMDDFQILLMRLARARTTIVIDKNYDSDDIYPEAEPEASFS